MPSLETYSDPNDLYLARLGEVNVNRPIFTGDVFELEDARWMIAIAHPCSIRGKEAQLLKEILTAEVSVLDDPPQPLKWASGFFARMPLPDLDGCFRSVALSALSRSETTVLLASRRAACLSEFGVNMLQQRLIFHLTRFVVPTRDLSLAFGHTYAEAELLEEWTDVAVTAGISTTSAATQFETAVRLPFDGISGLTLQEALLDPQLRSTVRARLRRQFMSG